MKPINVVSTLPAVNPPVDSPELLERVRELEEALQAIRSGQVDAVVIPGGIATSSHARAAADRLRQGTLEQMRDAVLAFDHAGHVVYMNPAAETQYGWSSVEALGRPGWEIYEERADRADPEAASPSCVASVHTLRDGRSIHVESTVSPLLDGEGSRFGSVAVVRDVTDRRRTEDRRDALARLGERLREAQDAMQAGVAAEEALLSGLGANSVECLWATSDAFAGFQADKQGVVPAAILPRGVFSAPIHVAGVLTAVLVACSHDALHRWTPAEVEFGREVADRTRATFERLDGATALRESEARLRNANENLETAIRLRTNELMVVEEALRQAQKMEAVGQLTGGLAHDFNNLLASISGSLQVLRIKIARGQPEGCERYVDMGLESVKRAAALTQRLLAFARRQTLDSKPTDINRLVSGMEDLIRRTVGDAVGIEVQACDGLWTTKVDPPQLESALLNLCLNARDGMMPAGGVVTIRTANLRVADDAGEEGLARGEYVVLSIADTGSGMTPETVARIFDPFFTTKPMGQGTGLGLSMVYGFVRQSGGEVRATSKVGVGTTMALYLPRHEGEADGAEAPAATEAIEPGRGETVMLIEDQDSIRVVLAETLEDAGYHVVTAADGAAGLKLLQDTGSIDLLITDVGLPGGLNGRQVADAARIGRPGLKVLFITGYAENAAVGDGQLDSGMEVLTKPFDLDSLTQRVRRMIA